MVVESTERFRVCDEPVEEMQGCPVAVLPGSIDWVFWILVAGLGKVVGKVGKCRALHVKAGRLGVSRVAILVMSRSVCERTMQRPCPYTQVLSDSSQAEKVRRIHLPIRAQCSSLPSVLSYDLVKYVCQLFYRLCETPTGAPRRTNGKSHTHQLPRRSCHFGKLRNGFWTAIVLR